MTDTPCPRCGRMCWANRKGVLPRHKVPTVWCNGPAGMSQPDYMTDDVVVPVLRKEIQRLKQELGLMNDRPFTSQPEDAKEQVRVLREALDYLRSAVANACLPTDAPMQDAMRDAREALATTEPGK